MKEDDLEETLDHIREKYGYSTVNRATLIEKKDKKDNNQGNNRFALPLQI